MNTSQRSLFDRLLAFQIDEPGTQLTFARRLARENGWSLSYAERVITEYKKFLFLALAAGHVVSPSEQVDQAWHLHLTYTRSYWDELCGRILNQSLHHTPTKGGPAEQDKHIDLYEQTLAAYEQLLGELPPRDIWPAAAQRFGEDLKHVTVNTARNWIVPKPRIASAIMETWGRSQRTPLMGAALIVFPLAAVTWNPLDWKGPQFLACYLAVMAAAVVAAFVARLVLGPHESSGEGNTQSPLSPYEAACLAGGPARTVQAAFVSMYHAGTLRIDSEEKQILGIFPTKAGMIHQGNAPSANAPELEKAIYDAASVPLAEATRLFTTGLPAAEEIRERLVARGLMQPRFPSLACVTAAIIMVSPLILGIPKIIVGLSRGKPIEYLLIACVATLVAAAMFLFVGSRLTKSGKAILENLRVKHSAVEDLAGDAAALLKPTELALAIGLFGAAILATGPLSSAYAMLPRTRNGSNASGGCSGGGCGAGGCGGGGCGGGGCGGCGS